MHLILGGPGTGKTTRLLDILEQEVANGTDPEEIAFCSFTNQAINTARDRIRERFGYKRKQLRYFRTLHSLAFRELGLDRSRVFTGRHLKKLGEVLNMEIDPDMSMSSPFSRNEGGKALFLENFARSTGRGLEDIWRELGEYVTWHRLKQFQKTLAAYKKEFRLYDFTDMLIDYTCYCAPIPVQVAIIDEAQDLNRAQWDMVNHAFQNSKRIYLAGDDDQAIYKWAGADVNYFLRLPADERETLPKSYRLAPDIFNFSQDIIRKVIKRYSKEWEPASHRGNVEFLRRIDHLELDGSWYFLARNKYHLDKFEAPLRAMGVHYVREGKNSVSQEDIGAIRDYEKWRKGEWLEVDRIRPILERLGVKEDLPTSGSQRIDHIISGGEDSAIWHESFVAMPIALRMYYLSLLRRGEDITTTPNVSLSTIHGVKGGEADNVVIGTDMTMKTYQNYKFDSDDEWRVFYVGITRARKNLYISLPTTTRHYPI